MIKENHRANKRDYDDCSRSASREREKRDLPARQSIKNTVFNGFKLHIANLPLGVSEEFVRLQFERFGKVDDVRIMRKDSNGQPLKGSLYAFVTMCSREDAGYALEMINQEKMLAWNVSYSKEKALGESPRSPPRNLRSKHRRNSRDNDEKPVNKHIELPAVKVSETYDQMFGRTISMLTEETIDNHNDNPDNFISYSCDASEETNTINHAALFNLLNDQSSSDTLQVSLEPESVKITENTSEKLSQTTASSEKSTLKGVPIRVRELWFGNLSQDLDEQELSYHVEMFGEIENIEYYTKPNTSFAFVKFREIFSATKASEATQNLRNILNSPNLKVAFSDHQRRKNVVGDFIDYERDDEMTSIVYVGFPSGATIAPEHIIREMFSSCGEVQEIFVHQTSKQNSAKSYALIEMATPEQAKYARYRLYLDDVHRENRIRLGDRNCELCILVKPKSKDSSGNFMNMRPNPMQRQSRYSQFHPHGDMHPHFQGPMGPFPRGPHNFPGHFNGPMMNNGDPRGHPNHHPMRGPFPGGPNHPQFHMGGPGPDNMDMPNKFMHPFGMHGGRFPMEHGPNGFYPNPHNPNFGNPNGFHMNFGPNGPHFNPNHPHNINMNHGFGPHGGFNQFEHERRMNEMEHSKMGFSNVASTTASSNAKSPNDKHDSGQDFIWSGCIAKNKQNQVGVDALLRRGDESAFQHDFNFNVSHRITFEEVSKQLYKAIVTFAPSNETQIRPFQEYIKYFLERERAGVISLPNHSLYLLPPCEKAFAIYKFGYNELLGVLVDNKETQSDHSTPKDKEQKEEEQPTDDIDVEEEDNNFDVNEVISILNNNTDLEKLLESV